MPLKTALTKLLGIKHPIVQGGMHHVGFAELAAAVSNAGGLGIITALTITANGGPEALRAEIRKARTLTDKPIGVNCTLLPVGTPPDWPSIVQIIIEEKIPVVETAGRAPGEIVQSFKKAGIVVMHKCVTIRHALSAIKKGVDVISMDGFDCAGHPGEEDLGNWILLAQAGATLPVPFIASGGVATGSQLAAALAMGACGVNMGTRFMATRESPIHANIKQAIVDGDHNDTMLVMRSVGNTERVYKNKTSLEVAAIEKKHPGEFNEIYPLVRGDNYRRSFHETGDTQSSVWSCGQVMALINDVPTCKDLIEGMVAEAEAIISKNVQLISKM